MAIRQNRAENGRISSETRSLAQEQAAAFVEDYRNGLRRVQWRGFLIPLLRN